MEKIFENTTEIATRESYDKALSCLKALISKATALGALDNPEKVLKKATKKSQPSPALREAISAHSSPALQGRHAFSPRPKSRL
jgi:hypothetical protein